MNLVLEWYSDADMANFPADKAELVAVVADRKLAGERSFNPFDGSDTLSAGER